MRYPAVTPSHQISESCAFIAQKYAKPRKNKMSNAASFLEDTPLAIVKKSKRIDSRNRQPKSPVATPNLNVL
jgi:hypothetical protein